MCISHHVDTIVLMCSERTRKDVDVDASRLPPRHAICTHLPSRRHQYQLTADDSQGWTANPCFNSCNVHLTSPRQCKSKTNATSSAIAQSQSPSTSAPTTTNANPSTSQTTYTANASSTQLAMMLAAAFHEADSLQKGLGLAQRQAAK